MTCDSDTEDMADNMQADAGKTIALVTNVTVEKVNLSDVFVVRGGTRAPGRGKLDPITVILRDMGGRGQVIVECWGSAWSAFYANFGSGTLRQFIAGMHPTDLAQRLLISTNNNGIHTPSHAKGWLNDITGTVIAVLKAELAESGSRKGGGA